MRKSLITTFVLLVGSVLSTMGIDADPIVYVGTDTNGVLDTSSTNLFHANSNAINAEISASDIAVGRLPLGRLPFSAVTNGHIPAISMTNLTTEITTNKAGAWFLGNISVAGTTAVNDFINTGTMTMSNAVNYGNAFRSPGPAADAEQFGGGAAATADRSTAVGKNATASGTNGTAFGYLAEASETSSSAIGSSAQATAPNASALGSGGIATGENSIAIGPSVATAPASVAIGLNALAAYENSIAIGVGSENTDSNQIMLGASGISTVVQNNLTVQTNLEVGGNATIGGDVTIYGNTALSNTTFRPDSIQMNLNLGGIAIVNTNLAITNGNLTVSGSATITGPIFNAQFSGTNYFPSGSDVSFGRYSLSTLANGNNAGIIVGTNVFVELSGPTADFNVNGIAGGRDGKILFLLQQTTHNMTIMHESGVEPVAANRIITMTGADRATTGNGAAILIYSGAISRWILISLDP